MLEVAGVEVGVELAVEDAQHVEVELGGDALAVVVGGLEHRRVLDQVGAEQQEAVVVEPRAQLAQEAPARAGGEVADRAAEEGDDARGAGLRRRDLGEVVLEVAGDALDLEAGVLLGQRGGGVADHAAVDVERHVALDRSGVEQHARLVGGAGAELDELARAGHRHDVVRARLQDRPLGAGRVVLGQLGDAVEELRAAGVVEVLGRQLLGRPGEAVERVVGERAARRAEGGHASHASRTPEKICRRWGRSQLRNVGLATRERVAHEPPRRT